MEMSEYIQQQIKNLLTFTKQEIPLSLQKKSEFLF